MTKEEAIKKCLNSKHNLSALDLDGNSHCHLKFGKEPMTRFIAALFKDCAEHRQTLVTWNGALAGFTESPTVRSTAIP
jgi:hypothetical protein